MLLALGSAALLAVLLVAALSWRGRRREGRRQRLEAALEALQTGVLGATPAEQARRLRECADLCVRELGDHERARGFIQEAEALSAPSPSLANVGSEAGSLRQRAETALGLRGSWAVLLQRARQAETAGNDAEALRHYQAAYDIDSTHLPTLLGLAALLYRSEDLDRAFKIYQTILVHHRDSQRDEEIVDIFYRLGNIKLKLGERKKALNMFEKALEIHSSHRETLLAVIDLQSKQNDWEAVLNAKRALIEVADEEERFRLLAESGDIALEKLKDQQRAIGYYQQALDLQPNSHIELHKLLELYTETKAWKKAVEVLVHFTEIEQDPALKSKYFYAVALIYRDEIKSLDESIDYFNQALDQSTDLLKAFAAIDQLYTQKKDWEALERNYRKMIKRLPAAGMDELKVMLWHNLGEIYRTQLRDFESAVAAFEVAVQLEPDNTRRHEILAELYQLADPRAFPE